MSAESIAETVTELTSSTPDLSSAMEGGFPPNSNAFLSNSTVQPLTRNEGSSTIISQEFAAKFSFISNAYVTPSLCVLGLLCNSLGLNILWREIKQQKLSIYKYLLALVCFDIIFLAISLIRVIPSVVQPFDLQLSKYIDSHMKLGIVYIDMTFSYTAKGMILVMSSERLISLVKPLHVKNMCLSKYPLAVISVCFIFNIMFLLPIPILAEVVTLQKGNETDYMFRFRNYENFMSTYMIVQVAVHDFFPIGCLIIINAGIPIQYYRIKKKRLSTLNINCDSISDQQGKITTTVLVITIFYILLTVPTVVLKFLQFFDPDYSIHGKYRRVLWFAIDINNLLSYINAANDFLVYFLVSNNYRLILTKRFCGCCYRGKENQTTLSSSESEPKEISSTSSSGYYRKVNQQQTMPCC